MGTESTRQVCCTTSSSNNNLNTTFPSIQCIWIHQFRGPMSWNYPHLHPEIVSGLRELKTHCRALNTREHVYIKQRPKTQMRVNRLLKLTSHGTSNSFNTFAASFITGRSESEPIIIATRGVTAMMMKLEIVTRISGKSVTSVIIILSQYPLLTKYSLRTNTTW